MSIFMQSKATFSDILFLVTVGNSLQLRYKSNAVSENMEITTKRMIMTRNPFNISNEYYLFH